MAVGGDRPEVVFRTLGANLWLAAVRGLAKTYRLSWDDIADVSGKKVTGAGRCVTITLHDGRTIPVRGCSSYSTAKLERTARAIADLRPSGEA